MTSISQARSTGKKLTSKCLMEYSVVGQSPGFLAVLLAFSQRPTLRLQQASHYDGYSPRQSTFAQLFTTLRAVWILVSSRLSSQRLFYSPYHGELFLMLSTFDRLFTVPHAGWISVSSQHEDLSSPHQLSYDRGLQSISGIGHSRGDHDLSCLILKTHLAGVTYHRYSND